MRADGVVCHPDEIVYALPQKAVERYVRFSHLLLAVAYGKRHAATYLLMIVSTAGASRLNMAWIKMAPCIVGSIGALSFLGCLGFHPCLCAASAGNASGSASGSSSPVVAAL